MAGNHNLSAAQFQQLHASLTGPDEGFSVDVHTGQAAPSAGWAVSIPGHEKRYGAGQAKPYTPAVLPQYVEKHAAALARPERYFGGWPTSGHYALDVSRRHEDFGEAHRAMFRGGQEAMFNLETGENYANVAHPEVRRQRREMTKTVLGHIGSKIKYPEIGL